MLGSGEVKDILYSTIESIGKERIRTDTTSNVKSSQKYIDRLMDECLAEISIDSSTSNQAETIAFLGEALLHFMLTVSTLPSERKIQVKDNLILDIVIPNLQSLKRMPDKSIIIEIIRNKVDLDKISHLEFFQPNYKNIWLLSVVPISIRRHRIYPLYSSTGVVENSFSNIIIDINDFLKGTGDKSLRFIH